MHFKKHFGGWQVLAGALVIGLSVASTCGAQTPALAQDTAPLRVVVLGDSITYAGDFVADVECWLLARGAAVELINLGLPSETATDLLPKEQQGHTDAFGFPRPALSDRLAAVLEKTRPNWVVACYGMNDAGALPNDDAGFARYCAALEKLRAQIINAGGQRFIVLTPPIHDAGAGQISAHDAMLARYSSWLLDKRKDGWEVIDLHGPLRAALDEKRQTTPDFRFAADGVHPNRAGHDVMARSIIAHFSTPVEATRFFADSKWLQPPIFDLVQQRMSVRRDAWLSFTGHRRPGLAVGLPMDEAEAKIAELNRQLAKYQSAPNGD